MKKITSVLSFILGKLIFPFTALFSLFMILMIIFGQNNRILIDKAVVLLIAAAGIALIDLVFYIPKISMYFKAATHFILLGLLFLAVLWLSDYMKTGNWVLLLVAYVIAYALICPAVLFVISRNKRKKAEQTPEDYSSKFN